MTDSIAFSDIRQELNAHVVSCPQCRSADHGVCPQADALLDRLLAASRHQDEEEATWY